MGTCLGRCFNYRSSRRYEPRQTFYFRERETVEFDYLMEKEQLPAQGCSLPRSLSINIDHVKCLLCYASYGLSISSFISMKKKKGSSQNGIPLEVVDDSWSMCLCDDTVSQSHLPCVQNPSSNQNASSIEFQALDARGLLFTRSRGGLSGFPQSQISVNSTPPSSLDLEWEHEVPGLQSLRQEEMDSDSATSLSQSRQSRSHHQQLKRRSDSRHGSAQNSSTASKDGSRMTTPDSLEWDFVESTNPEIDIETEQLLCEIEQLAARALQETGEHSSNPLWDSFLDENR